MTERDPTHETMTEDTRATETEPNRPTTERTDYRPELGDVSHTNPYTGTVFGDTQTYNRGRTVAADGGEASSESRASSEAEASDGRERNVTDDAETADGSEASGESRPSSEAEASDGDERDVDEEVMKDVAHSSPAPRS